MEMRWGGSSRTETRGHAADRGWAVRGTAATKSLAHIRLTVQESRAVLRPGRERRGRVCRLPFALWMSGVISVMLALGLAHVGDAMGRMGSAADLDEPVEVRVIESDLAEPFVVCTLRPQVTRCRELDLRSGPP